MMAGYVYLIELYAPLGSDRHSAQYYLGSCKNLLQRWQHNKRLLNRKDAILPGERKAIAATEIDFSSQANFTQTEAAA